MVGAMGHSSMVALEIHTLKKGIPFVLMEMEQH